MWDGWINATNECVIKNLNVKLKEEDATKEEEIDYDDIEDVIENEVNSNNEDFENKDKHYE